jgi:hypothetical protein
LLVKDLSAHGTRPILKLCIDVCVGACVRACAHSCQPEGRFDPQSLLQTAKKEGWIGVKVPFTRSMIAYIAHIPFSISVCSVRLTALLFSKLNKQGLLSGFHAHKCNGYVVYSCDLFATFLSVEMV